MHDLNRHGAFADGRGDALDRADRTSPAANTPARLARPPGAVCSSTAVLSPSEAPYIAWETRLSEGCVRSQRVAPNHRRPLSSERLKKPVGRRKRLPHKNANPCASTWDRRFRLSIRRTMVSTIQLARYDVVDIAPDPGLAWFDGADQGVLGRAEMPGGVLVPGVVATTYVPARQAEPEVHPGVARFEAFLAALLTGMRNLDLFEMGAWLGHVQTSNAARSQLASRAPASYVLSRNSHRVSSGDSARRTWSYIRMNSESGAFQLAPAGRTGCVSKPGG